jgi:hypothetical protein
MSEFDVLMGRQFGSNRGPLWRSDMTTVGIGLIVVGVALVCGGLILWPRAPHSRLGRLLDRIRLLEIDSARPAVPSSVGGIFRPFRRSIAQSLDVDASRQPAGGMG